jgi:hypothetical protein
VNTQRQPSFAAKGILRTIAVAGVIGLILFAVLWYAVFSAVTAALLASGATGVIVVGSSFSDALESLLDMLAAAFLAVLGAIAAVFSAILSIFN